MIRLLSSGSLSKVPISIQDFVGLKLIIALIVVTGGTMLLMWIGELISENGVGNGISLIITLGIISGIPTMLRNTFALIGQGGLETGKLIGFVGFIVFFLVAVAFIILINEAQRNIPVSYARRVRGPRMVGGVDTYLPLRVNQGGVIPIIFAMSLLLFPGTIARFLQNASAEWLKNAATTVANVFNGTSLTYGIMYFVLVIAFTFFYTGIVFNPTNVAENLQKQGGFIPGVRPGTETRNFLSKLLMRINLIGGIFLGIIAVLPFIIQRATGITTIVLGGTSILIMVSVVLDTARQVKSQFLMRSYNY
jgi:preprotein translocase subunit SecY